MLISLIQVEFFILLMGLLEQEDPLLKLHNENPFSKYKGFWRDPRKTPLKETYKESGARYNFILGDYGKWR